MRNFLQTKLSEDHADKVKTKEKSSSLFNELVRIGQQSEAQRSALARAKRKAGVPAAPRAKRNPPVSAIDFEFSAVA